MTQTQWTRLIPRCKALLILAAALPLLAACAVNPATGDRQFTALMSPGQEQSVGASEHEKVMRQFGAPQAGDPLQAYVARVGAKLAANTERGDVTYKFFLLDTPMLNAFALPGGYVYVTRGILAQADDEAELAAVLAHEIGHVTARHSAERYSQGVLASLGTAVIAAATDNGQIARAAGVGTDLYLKSYSRGQESQADELGIRYLVRAGYDPQGMTRFLESLDAHDALEQKMAGRSGGTDPAASFFATHPRTAERVAQAASVAASYPPATGGGSRADYLAAIDGMIYGDSARQGFAREEFFWHPEMGFTFAVPPGFRIDNQPDQIVAYEPSSGAAAIFDATGNPQRMDPAAWLSQSWMKGQLAVPVETIDVNGMKAATAAFPGKIGNRPATIRLVAVAWAPDAMYRFQIGIPQGAPSATIENLKRLSYSLRRMTERERQTVRPYRLRVITARAGDSVASLAARMPDGDFREDRFRVLNGIAPDGAIVSGQAYKVVE